MNEWFCTQVIGKKGTIEEIDEDGDVKVLFGEYTWIMNPECLSPCDGPPDVVRYDDPDTPAPKGSL